MFIDVADKKEFLIWLVHNVSFSQREILWILNYLINHEAILNNVHFIEQADKTTRGIKIHSVEMDQEPIILYVQEQQFRDTDQIFHEIRMNWNKPLYLECVFEDSWQNSYYLSILEDNPFARWNEQIDEELFSSINQYFAKEEKEAAMKVLYEQINAALENENLESFLKLTEELNQLKRS